MKTINLFLTICMIAIAISSCDNEHFDVNVPLDAVDSDQLDMKDLMAPVIHSTITGQRSVSTVYSNYSQYIVGQGGTASGFTSASGLWNEIYLYIFPNIAVIKEKAQLNGSIHYDGISDVLLAINLGIATDTWDNVPYTESAVGQENLFPAFDEQETLYPIILQLLDDAITKLSQNDTSGKTPSRDDLIYGGDIGKWLRAAYTLKARYQLRLVSKGVLNPSEVVASISNGFTSNADDFQMFYDERNQNPWYTIEVVARSTGNFHNDIAEQLVSTMNGDLFPFSTPVLTEDPRLRVFVDNDFDTSNEIPDDIIWKGYVSGGQGLALDGTPGNTAFAGDSFYTSINSPITLITYAEAEFIKAEAEFLANGGNENSIGSSGLAYMAYMNGIQASMDRFNVDGSVYMMDGSVDVGADNLKLEHIMKEKYIHNFLNPETFSDFRRYDFSENVFRGLEIRDGTEDEDPEFAGEWFRRADYPATERDRNSENVSINEQSVINPVWWDE